MKPNLPLKITDLQVILYNTLLQHAVVFNKFIFSSTNQDSFSNILYSQEEKMNLF